MYIECQNCHANNHINTECVNCHAPLDHHTSSKEYQAIDECINKFYTHNNKLSICSQALEKMQAQYPNTEEINLVMLNAFAQIQSQQP